MKHHLPSLDSKHPQIRDFLGKLEASMPSGGFQIVDFWDADPCAIGVAAPDDQRRLVYVSTYEQEDGTYAFECEAPPGDGTDDSQVVDQGENLLFDELARKIRSHLLRAP